VLAFRTVTYCTENEETPSTASLSDAQFDALVLGLPWQRLGDGGVITVV
jgi:hypothetical protein